MIIEIAYIAPEQKFLRTIQLPNNSNVKQAIIASEILDIFSNWDINDLKLGVFSKRVTLDTMLQEADRLEIYRPLLVDPKQRRRNKAKK